MQNTEELRDYCLALPGVSEDFPFDESTLVFKVGGKMFALCSLNWSYFAVNLKCDPERAVQLRESYPAIQPGYHMHKKHWNTVRPDEGLPPGMLEELVRHSYDLILAGLPKKVQPQIQASSWKNDVANG